MAAILSQPQCVNKIKNTKTMLVVGWTILYAVYQCIIPHSHYIPMNTTGFL